ncbi:MAG: amidohydrolase family protein [Pseudomonadales bacterium]|nr:amidohydrolase family protein [Pseudomonadales bacterium]
MKNCFLLIITLVFCNQTSAQNDVLIENITILSSHLAQAQPGQNVLLSNGLITRISSDPIETDAGIQVIDGTDKFLSPGIFDSHVHVSSVPGFGFAVEERAQQQPDLIEDYFLQLPRSLLYYGVTQVLDPNPGASSDRFVNQPTRSHYFKCEVVTSTETFPYVELDSATASRLYSRYLIDTNESSANIASIVREIANSGAICLKLYFEDGYGNANNWPFLADETLSTLVEQAHDNGLMVVAHANALDMYEKALSYSIDVLAHGVWNWGEFNRSSDIPDTVASILDEIANRNIGVMPTLRIIAGIGELAIPSFSGNEEFTSTTPGTLQNWYSGPQAQWFKNDLLEAENVSPEIFLRIYRQGIVGRGARAMMYLHELDHPILLGSDTPGSPSYVNQPGLNTLRELELMAEYGIPLSDIFKSATINNASQFGVDDLYGTVEEGKIANLLLLSENPLVEIGAWNSIDTVFLDGVPINRSDLLPIN